MYLKIGTANRNRKSGPKLGTETRKSELKLGTETRNRNSELKRGTETRNRKSAKRKDAKKGVLSKSGLCGLLADL